jgi:hypothetical protein
MVRREMSHGTGSLESNLPIRQAGNARARAEKTRAEKGDRKNVMSELFIQRIFNARRDLLFRGDLVCGQKPSGTRSKLGWRVFRLRRRTAMPNSKTTPLR